MELFRTDFYQVSMGLAYIVLGQANHRTGFEAFVRKINPAVTTKPYYDFMGEQEVHEFMSKIRRELSDINKVKDLFAQIVLPKVHVALRNKYYQKIKSVHLETTFGYSVAKDGDPIYPLVPAFQFYGPKWIGQLIETRICLLINGQTGHYSNEFMVEGERFSNTSIVYPNRDGLDDFNAWMDVLRAKAVAIREAAPNILLEASYRRAPSDEAANAAAKIAIEAGWNGTSNLGAWLDGHVSLDKIGGTMAHSFVMSHRTEYEAMDNWAYVWPNSTLLIDTYDTVACAKMIVEENISFSELRIDSDPLAELAQKVRAIIPKDKDLFLSGDLDEEKYKELRHVSFYKSMAGTKYVSGSPELAAINAGFVYKVVHVEDEKGIFYPQKKSTGKSNYPKLKTVSVKNGVIYVDSTNGYGIDLTGANFEDSPVFSCDLGEV